MRRCSGWRIGIALFIMVVASSCGGTGGGPANSGQPLVFQLRGRLSLIAQTTNDPRRLLLVATLLDPQGLPFRDRQISFTAEFEDALFVPGSGNLGTALTDDNGQAKITLVAGFQTGMMRIIAEAPPELNLSSGITVQLTVAGYFPNLGTLGILPAAVTFVNPAIAPSSPTLTVFEALGGRPPYQWRNSNESLADITPLGPSGVDSQAEYRLLDPLPAATAGAALSDTVTLVDAELSEITASVQVLFSECNLSISPATINIGGAVGGEQAQITVQDAIPPLTVTSTFPDAGTITIDQDAGIVTFTVATSPVGVSPETLLIRDSRGCRATVEITITPAPAPQLTSITMEANPPTINGVVGGMSIITANVFDENNLPLEGIEVLFTTTVGSLNSPTATTNAAGEAVVTLTIPPGTAPGTATITGSAQGVEGMTTVEIVDPRDLVALIKLESSLLVFDGVLGGQSDITATVFDDNNLPIPGVEVLFMADRGALGALTATTDAAGEAIVTLTIPAGTPGGVVMVMASAQGIEATIDIPILGPTGQPLNIVLAASPLTIDGALGGTSAITAFVFDANNLPIEGLSLLFTTTGGTVSPVTATTNAAGQTVVALTIPAGTPDGTVTVTGAAQDIFGSVDITLLAGSGGGGGGGGGLVPASIECVSASPTTIGVRGSGLAEQSTLTFLVTTVDGIPVPSTMVEFFVTSLGGESVSPTTGLSNMNGEVQTVLTSGTRANDVAITAAVDVNGDMIFDVITQCTLVTIVGAPPVQGRLSLARTFANVAGRVTLGLQDGVTAFMNDRFGNPVPTGTAVSFTTNAGLVTGQGVVMEDEEGNRTEASAILQTQGPFTPEGLVIVMAHTVGQEPFIDNNGNGIFDTGTDTISNDDIPEPFIDRNGNCMFDPNDPFEIFIDVNGNGMWDASQGTPGTWDDQIFVWDTTPVIFSSGTVAEVNCDSGCDPMNPDRFLVPDGGSATLEILVRDPDGNPLTSASLISVSIEGAGAVNPTRFIINDATNCRPNTCDDDPSNFPGDGSPGDDGADMNPNDNDPPSWPPVPPGDPLVIDLTNPALPRCGRTNTGLTRFLVTVADADAGDMMDDGMGGMVPGDPEPATVTIEIMSAIGKETDQGGNGSVTLTINGDVD